MPHDEQVQNKIHPDRELIYVLKQIMWENISSRIESRDERRELYAVLRVPSLLSIRHSKSWEVISEYWWSTIRLER